MRIAEDLTNLGEGMVASFDDRLNFIGRNIVDVQRHERGTHAFLNDCRKHHKAMAKKLRADLGAFVNHLSETVDQMRKGFQLELKGFQKEQKKAHQAWGQVTKTMAATRRNFNNTLMRAKQKAARAH